MTEYRFAEISDIEFIFSSLNALIEHERSKDGQIMCSQINRKSAQDIDQLKSALFSKQPLAEVLLAEFQQVPVGLCMFSITNRNFDIFEKPGIYLHDLYVSPNYRRQGIATGILTEMQVIAKTRGCGRIEWLVLKNNITANEFYRNFNEAKEVDHVRYLRIPVS